MILSIMKKNIDFSKNYLVINIEYFAGIVANEFAIVVNKIDFHHGKRA